MTDQIIAGIYHYCDRWCERCLFTSRCQCYKQCQNPPLQQSGISKRLFRHKLHEKVLNPPESLFRSITALDLLANDITPEEYIENVRETRKIAMAFQSDLTGLCSEYNEEAVRFLELPLRLQEKSDELMQQYKMGIQSKGWTMQQLNEMKDHLDVIIWYLQFIYIKIIRAQYAKLDEAGSAKKCRLQKDSDGSAKIAIIAIECSMKAWKGLYELFPENEDDILPLLVLLEKIKNITDTEFPNARRFIRPGFDEATR